MMKTLLPLLSLLFIFGACERKIFKADYFDSVSEGKGQAPFFGKIVPEVRFGKKPACRVEIAGKEYELPDDGMVYLWAPKGEVIVDSVSCFRDHNWLPKIVFTETLPLFQNVGDGKISYFGTLKVKVRDPEDIAPGAQGPFKTQYSVVDDMEASEQILRDNFSSLSGSKVEKHLIVPTPVK